MLRRHTCDLLEPVLEQLLVFLEQEKLAQDDISLNQTVLNFGKIPQTINHANDLLSIVKGFYKFL